MHFFKTLNNITQISGFGNLLPAMLKQFYQKSSKYYLDLQLKLIFNGIFGIRLVLIMIIILFGGVLVLDFITVAIFLIFKTSIIPMPTVIYEVQPQEIFFVTEKQKAIYFKMQAHDQLKYYREVYNMLGIYQPPKPVRFWDHCPPFPPLREIYEDYGLISVTIDATERLLMYSDWFKYIYGVLYESEEVHMEDVALGKELKAIVDAMRDSNDPEEQELGEEYWDDFITGIDMRRYALPSTEFYLVSLFLIGFIAGEYYLWVPEFLVFDKMDEMVKGAIPLIFKKN